MDCSYATLRCDLKVHRRCHACNRHINDILRSIVGPYDLTADGARLTTTIIGQVDPNFCTRAIGRCNDGHAEPMFVNLSHPRMRERSYGYDYETSSYYDRIPYGSRMSLPMPGMYHDYPRSALRGIPEYSYTSGYDYYDRDRIYRRNPIIPYNSDEEYYSSSLCTIM